MRAFKTTVRPSYIIKQRINKKLLQEGNIHEILKLMNIVSVFCIQNFITTSTWIRLHKIVDAAQAGRLKLNINKDKICQK